MGDGLPHYEVSDADSGPGSSLGNGYCWINLASDGRIQSMFCTEVGEEVAGPLLVRYASADANLAECSGSACSLAASVPLEQVGTGRFIIHPVYQQHVFDLPGDVEVCETVFIPQAEGRAPADECVAYYGIELRNRSGTARSVSAFAFAKLGGTRRRASICADYDSERGAIFAAE